MGGRLEMVNMAPLAMDGRRLRNGEVRIILSSARQMLDNCP